MKKITKELRQKSKEELAKEVDLLRSEIAKLNLNRKSNPAKDSNLIYKKRKKLAAALTILKEQEKS